MLYRDPSKYAMQFVPPADRKKIWTTRILEERYKGDVMHIPINGDKVHPK